MSHSLSEREKKNISMIRINKLFDIHTAQSLAFADYAPGSVPFVSNGFYNNGIVGYVDPYGKSRVFEKESICVSAFCEATVQKPPFLPRGNGGSGLTVLVPKMKMPYSLLLRYAGMINTYIRWRYSYGRMVNKQRLDQESLPEVGKAKTIPLDKIGVILSKEKSRTVSEKKVEMGSFPVETLFEMQHGDFHSINELDAGNYPTVSRIEFNNGVVGYFDKPDGASVYKPLTLTVSTVTGDCFVQLSEYIATDNVVILSPKRKCKPETLFFMAMMINREKWRWMYGRQCYKTKFSSIKINLPINSTGIVDEGLISGLVSSRWGWGLMRAYLNSTAIPKEKKNPG